MAAVLRGQNFGSAAIQLSRAEVLQLSKDVVLQLLLQVFGLRKAVAVRLLLVLRKAEVLQL